MKRSVVGVFLVLVLAGCSARDYLYDENAGLNGGFETTQNNLPVNWEFFPKDKAESQASLDSSAHSGNVALKIVAQSADLDQDYGLQSISVVKTARYVKAGFSGRSTGNVQVQFEIRWLDDQSSLVTNRIYHYTLTNTDWLSWSSLENLGENASSVQLRFVIVSPGTLWLDDVSLDFIQ